MPPSRRPVVLLEDDAVLRDLIAEVLREHGHPVVEATQADAAMAAVDAADGDAILIADRAIDGPGPNGFQLAGAALERHPALRVIYVSGTHVALRHRRLSERERGLMKPFALSQLLTLIRQLG